MAKATADRPMLKMFEAPADIAANNREYQSAAPYYGLGFKKGRLDPALHGRMMQKFAASAPLFRAEHKIDVIRSENPGMIPAVFFEDREFSAMVSRALQPAHEEWCGMPLEESACYGIRVYQRGTFMYKHVDRTHTHHISSTICVDHRLDSRWPLYIEDIEGKPCQIDLEPGEFVFYEGARLMHGRPYPLDGDYYAGMFVHYRPLPAAAAQSR